MQSFRYLARAIPRLAAAALRSRTRPGAVRPVEPAGMRSGRRPGRVRRGLLPARLMAIVAIAFTAVLAGSTFLPRLTAGTPGRAASAPRGPGARTTLAVAPRTARGGTAAAGTAAASGSESGDRAGLRADLATRLGDILRLRERAYARRDGTILDSISTWDCACLRSGRAAIARLLADHAVWRGRSVSVRVERLSRVNDSLWIAVAVLRRSAFRIEREDGTLLRAVPAARQRYRFALVWADRAWLLGHASLIGELSP
jgi:hypothetical protein